MKVIFQLVNSIQFNLKKTFISGALDLQKMSFYAVARGRTVGIYMTWADCEAQVKGFSGARYKKFDTAQNAQDFITMEGGKAPAPTNNFMNQSKWSKSNAGPANPSLKRSYSTSNNNKGKSSKQTSSKSRFRREPSESEYDSDDRSDDSASDDLFAIINKQMDDIEKRTKDFGKGLDKIMKKNTVKTSSRKAILIEPPQSKKQKPNDNNGFEVDSDGYVQVYTDGACSANGTAGARAGLGVYWGEGHSLNTSEPVSGRATNNCGEIQAATCAIKQALQNEITKLTVNTDSQFLINSVTKWMTGWKRKGWKLASGEPVKNVIDFKELDSLQHKLQVRWNYVEAHRGVHGNERADQLAKAGAALYKN